MERGEGAFGGKYLGAVIRAQVGMDDGVQTSPDLSSWILVCRRNQVNGYNVTQLKQGNLHVLY